MASAVGRDKSNGKGNKDKCDNGQLTFREVLPSTDDTIVVPAGYTWESIAPWGTPLLAVAFAEDASNTAAEQALQVGFNHDGMHFFRFSLLAIPMACWW